MTAICHEVTSDSPKHILQRHIHALSRKEPLKSTIPAEDDAVCLSGTAFAVAIAAERCELCCCIWSAGKRKE